VNEAVPWNSFYVCCGATGPAAPRPSFSITRFTRKFRSLIVNVFLWRGNLRRKTPGRKNPERCRTASRIVLLGMVPVLMLTAADHGLLFHHGPLLSPDFRGLNGGSLPTGAGADDYEIKRSAFKES